MPVENSFNRVQLASVLSVIVVFPAAAEVDATTALLGFTRIQPNCPCQMKVECRYGGAAREGRCRNGQGVLPLQHVATWSDD